MHNTETLTEPLQIDSAINALLARKANNNTIMVYNDNVNTFNHVIHCLMVYCNHTAEQAEQTAYIIHHNGKCDVKHGRKKDLIPIWEALLEMGLTAKIV
jgi:ATP-dependent Clp protease adaptor protein ClpS